MRWKDWLSQAAALLVAWMLLLCATYLLDRHFGKITQLCLVLWLCIGMGIMLIKKIDFPVPRWDTIDVIGAFRMLWWAGFWPRYVLWR